VRAAGQTTAVANQTGSAHVSHALGTLEAVIAFRRGARLQPFAGLGGGAYRIGIAGVSNDPAEPPAWLDHTTQVWAGAASASCSSPAPSSRSATAPTPRSAAAGAPRS
jgi:hypothetical protein